MSARGNVEVSPTADALMRAAAALFADRAAAAIDATGRFVVALAGGSTPKGLYALLASDDFATAVDWTRVHVGWGDERCVAPDDPASNYRMAEEALLDHVPIPARQVHRIHGEDEPHAAAAAYERTLRALFATAEGPPLTTPGARFDLVLLGLGDDGHTASLFPGMTAVRERRRWAVAELVTPGSAGPSWRVTLTPPVLDAAAEVAFLVAGGGKAPALRRVLEGPHRPDELPAQAIEPSDGRVRWLVDAAAAAEL